jgi:hypothetical protein
LCEPACLLEQRLAVGRGCGTGAEDLDRHRTPQLSVVGEVHRTAAARAQRPTDLVTAERARRGLDGVEPRVLADLIRHVRRRRLRPPPVALLFRREAWRRSRAPAFRRLLKGQEAALSGKHLRNAREHVTTRGLIRAALPNIIAPSHKPAAGELFQAVLALRTAGHVGFHRLLFRFREPVGEEAIELGAWWAEVAQPSPACKYWTSASSSFKTLLLAL